MTLRIEQLLQSKGDHVHCVHPDDSVIAVVRLMAEKSIGAVPVVENGKLLGIFSERDYARRIVLTGRADITPVYRVMTSPVRYVEPGQTIEHCMALMTEKRMRHLPVLEDGQLRGIISIGDLVKAVIQDQQHTIEELERYITG